MKFPFLPFARRMSVAALLSCCALASPAQQKSETLSNKNVIELTKAGLSSDLIIAKINASSCKFDLSSTGLIDLKKQGIKDDVLAAMMNKDGSGESSGQSSKTDGNSITLLNNVHVLIDGKAKPLEKQIASTRSKMKAFGYGGASVVLQISGKASPMRLSVAARKFLVRTSGTSPEIVLYKAKVDGSTRQAETMKATVMGMRPTKSIVPTDITALKDGLYEISIPNALESGEYFFTAKQATTSAGIEAFAFGVD